MKCDDDLTVIKWFIGAMVLILALCCVGGMLDDWHKAEIEIQKNRQCPGETHPMPSSDGKESK